jgi:aminopeptidase N
MWAGNQTTLAGTYDFVWKESMAEYLPGVWEDMQSSADGMKTWQAWKAFSKGARYYPVPLDSPPLFSYYGDVYGPGPMILFRQLEVLTSRAQVLTAIQSVLGSAHSLSVDELVAALSASTGLDLGAYAAGWIRGMNAPPWPKYNVTYTAGSLQLTQVNKGLNPMGCKFHVALDGANGEEQLVEVNTFANGLDQTIDVTPSFTVTDVVLDPLAECLVYPMTLSPKLRPEPLTSATHPWSGHR